MQLANSESLKMEFENSLEKIERFVVEAITALEQVQTSIKFNNTKL